MQKPDATGSEAEIASQPPSDGEPPDASCAIEESACNAASPAPLKDVVSHDAAAVAGTTSIYDFWTPRRRAMTLAVVSISQFLNPISQNIVLPGLKVRTVCYSQQHSKACMIQHEVSA